MSSAFSQNFSVSPITFPDTLCYEKYGRGIIEPDKLRPAMTPIVTPDGAGFPHVYLPFETPASPGGYSQVKIAFLYRGNMVGVHGVHLYLVNNVWCFRHDNHHITTYFTLDGTVVRVRGDGRELDEFELHSGSVEYMLIQAVSGDFTGNGTSRKKFAKIILDGFSEYARSNAGILAGARDEANIAKMENEIQDLTKRLANLEQEQRDLIERKRLVENARAERLHAMRQKV